MFSTTPPAGSTSPGSATRYCTRPSPRRSAARCRRCPPGCARWWPGRLDRCLRHRSTWELGRADRGLRGRRWASAAADRRLGALEVGAVVVELSGGTPCLSRASSSVRAKRVAPPRARHGVARPRPRRRFLGLPLRHQALGGLDADPRPVPAAPRPLSAAPRARRVHPGQNLPGSDEVALVHQDLFDPARYLGGDVDLRRLDAAIAAGETIRQPFRCEGPPGHEDGGSRDRDDRNPEQPHPAQRLIPLALLQDRAVSERSLGPRPAKPSGGLLAVT